MAEAPENTPFPKRPALGTVGRKIRPYANFFEFSLPKKPDLYQLDVKFSNPKLPRDKRQEVFRQLRIMYPKFKVYYDDTAIAFTDSKFEGGSEIMTEEVALPSGRPDSDPIKVTLKIVSTLTYSDLAAFLSGNKEMTSESYSYLNLLNIYAFHFAANDPALVAFGKSRCFFMLNGERVRLQGGLELLFGGFMSVRWGGVDLNKKPSEKLYLNIDTVATTFDTPGPLLDRVRDEFPRINPSQKLSRQDLANVSSFLKKKKVNVTHRGATFKKWYIITGVTDTSASQTFFEMDGKKVSVAQHFQNAYKINLKYPNLNCVTVRGGPSGKMDLPMEVCVIPEGVRHVGLLSGPQTSDIIKKTATKPAERQRKIYDLNRIISNGQARDNSLGVKISDKMVMVDGRVIPEPKVRYGEKKVVPPNKGSWNLLGAKFTDPRVLENWILMDLKGDDRIAHGCVDGFVEHATARGMTVNAKPLVAQGNPHANLEPIFKQAAARVQNVQLIMVILPSEHAELYNMVKRICDCILGIPTQCLVFKKLLRADGQYYSNVALKVNHKLGGTNNALTERLPLFDRPTMIVGADVTHPGGMSANPSIASVVASVNTDANLYVAKIDFQKSRKEFIENFEEMFLQLIRAFYLNNKRVLPERIVHYRDGVGETMFKEVKRLEIAAMNRAFDRVPKPYSANIKDARYRPKVTMIVVQKRHHARFFPENPKDADKSGNCPAGMVVETVITNPGSFDFYLQSQAGLQGTSRPTHYQILHDENKFTADSLQELTYRMCYLQGRSTRSVSIVPAVYHADLACFRARSHLLNPDWSESSSGKTRDANIDDLRSKLSPKLDSTMWWM